MLDRRALVVVPRIGEIGDLLERAAELLGAGHEPQALDGEAGMSASGKEAAGVLGIGVAACAVCCAGPILGFLAAVGIGTVVGVAVFGVVGLAVALLTIVPIVRRRRAAAACAPSASEPVTLGRKPS